MSDTAKAAAIHAECIKVGYRQAKEGPMLTLRLHPDDMTNEIATAPLGQRFAVAFVPLKDAE
jgi:hypothetical protein